MFTRLLNAVDFLERNLIKCRGSSSNSDGSNSQACVRIKAQSKEMNIKGKQPR